VGWLHCLVGHGQQLAGQGVQVDLVAQAGAERGDNLGGPVGADTSRLNGSAACWMTMGQLAGAAA
jgi:hypothetical protein